MMDPILTDPAVRKRVRSIMAAAVLGYSGPYRGLHEMLLEVMNVELEVIKAERAGTFTPFPRAPA